MTDNSTQELPPRTACSFSKRDQVYVRYVLYLSCEHFIMLYCITSIMSDLFKLTL